MQFSVLLRDPNLKAPPRWATIPRDPWKQGHDLEPWLQIHCRKPGVKLQPGLFRAQMKQKPGLREKTALKTSPWAGGTGMEKTSSPL